MLLFLLGIVGGIALSLFFSFGPAFFSQIQASIHYGFRNAVPFVFGVSASDVLIVLSLLLISRNVPIDNLVDLINNRWVLYTGACILCAFGLYTMFLKTKRTAGEQETERISFQNVQAPSHFSIFMRGLLLNIFNPLLWIYWSTLVTLLLLNESDLTIAQRCLFFTGVLVTTLSMDILKCKLASLLQRIITYRFLKIFNKCIGLILIGFAAFMVYSASPKADTSNNQKSVEMMEGLMNSKPQMPHFRHRDSLTPPPPPDIPQYD